MMENLPPFYVGQKVVQLFDGVHGKSKKGDVRTVLGLKLCCQWLVDVGTVGRPGFVVQRCPDCGIILNKYPGTKWIDSTWFAPIEENFQSISLEKVLEEETKLISVN